MYLACNLKNFLMEWMVVVVVRRRDEFRIVLRVWLVPTIIITRGDTGGTSFRENKNLISVEYI